MVHLGEGGGGALLQGGVLAGLWGLWGPWGPRGERWGLQTSYDETGHVGRTGVVIQIPCLFFSLYFFSLFFFLHVLCINQLLGTKTTCSASYGKERTPSPVCL